MSVEHAIDLSAESQGVFNTSIKDILKNATYWAVCDQLNQNLLSNVDFDLKTFLYHSENQPVYSQIPFLSIIFIESHNYAVVSPYYIHELPVLYCGKKCTLYSYYKILSSDFYHFLFKNSDFNKFDYLGNELSFDDIVSRLEGSNPLDILTNKEWAISWLLISGFSTTDISVIMQIKINTVKKYIERILGVKKLAIFKRELFIQIAIHLGWNLFIPSFFVKKTTVQKVRCCRRIAGLS